MSERETEGRQTKVREAMMKAHVGCLLRQYFIVATCVQLLHTFSELNPTESCKDKEGEWQSKKPTCRPLTTEVWTNPHSYCQLMINTIITHGLILLENLCRRMRAIAVRTAIVVHMVLLLRTSCL